PDNSGRIVVKMKITTDYPITANSIAEIRSADLYRYLQGHYTTLDEAKKALPSVQAKGFADAFIVAYRGTDRISVSEAESLTQ
ncbi:MAG: SPOR domain-containing protein, partial [Flavobacteriia bacterium]|nr:SPOR domain-containing protein [Flavobacteriia bacterium]